VGISFARSATRHRISRKRSRYVVEHTATVLRQPAPEASPLRDDRIVFLGPDADGVMLEVMAIEVHDGLRVIHAMQIRKRYEPFVEGRTR